MNCLVSKETMMLRRGGSETKIWQETITTVRTKLTSRAVALQKSECTTKGELSNTSYGGYWNCINSLDLFRIEQFSNDCRKPKPKQLLRPITTGAESAMNQSQFLAITCNSLEAREKSRVRGAIGFGFASHWLKN